MATTVFRPLSLLLVLAAALLSVPALAVAGIPEPLQPVAERQLSGNVWEYDYLLSTGAGPYSQIGVHRVVEVVNGQPVETKKSVFLAHGDVWGFDAAFLGGSHAAYSLPVYLASHGVDVWGIDFAWTLIPAGAHNLARVRGWGLQHDVNDLEQAIAFARGARAAAGAPSGPMPLLAWSRGGWIGYALLNQETQLPKAERQVSGFISVDNEFKTNDPTSQAFWCSEEQAIDTDIADHVYAFDNTALPQIGSLAANNPDDPSPYDPPLTNLQFALVLGAGTFQLGPSFTPFYHYVAGTFPHDDPTAIPTGLRYTPLSRWEQFLEAASPYEPAAMIRDTAAITCGDSTSTYDNHLAQITVPVLYVGAAGGFGTSGLYTLSRLGSSDLTTKIVSFERPTAVGLDFGHVDLFNASNAEQAVWAPIYHWLNNHEGETHD